MLNLSIYKLIKTYKYQFIHAVIAYIGFIFGYILNENSHVVATLT